MLGSVIIPTRVICFVYTLFRDLTLEICSLCFLRKFSKYLQNTAVGSPFNEMYFPDLIDYMDGNLNETLSILGILTI